MIKTAIKRIFELTGYTLYKRGIEQHTLPSAMKRIAEVVHNPSTIIDIGAAEGTWTQMALEYWPQSKYHLIEPLKEQQKPLQELARQFPLVQHHLAVAGDSAGEVAFMVSDDLDGSGVYDQDAPNSRKVPVITLNSICNVENGPFIIKFDTHGYEVPILTGASDILPHTAAIIMEVYGFRVSPTCLLFHEITAHLETLGFRLADIVDVVRRPGDNMFWQADAVYLRHDNHLFQRSGFK